jgi:hypothetical protein
MYRFEVKIRLAGSVSYVTVNARDAAQARRLVQAQYGAAVTLLQTKRV